MKHPQYQKSPKLNQTTLLHTFIQGKRSDQEHQKQQKEVIRKEDLEARKKAKERNLKVLRKERKARKGKVKRKIKEEILKIRRILETLGLK